MTTHARVRAQQLWRERILLRRHTRTAIFLIPSAKQ
jgi:hypothetical protein